mgnify:CR=1 FL=1
MLWLILALIASEVAMLLIGPRVLPVLRKLKFGQTIYELGPKSHRTKQGTPTMGGLCFILGSTLGLGFAMGALYLKMPELFEGGTFTGVWQVMFCAFAFGMVGFVDDYVKVARKRNLGLRAWQKILLQLAITTAFLLSLAQSGKLTTLVSLPVFGAVDLGFWYFPLSYLFIIFMVNAVNLTDGIDGLASSVTFVVMVGYLVIAGFLDQFGLSLYAAALGGALAGFLVWNFYPAKTFMGDTGSMFLGGAVTAMAYCMGRPELLLFMGFVYICEAASVVIQVTYFKCTHGKRLFKMTPIHHSFELSGWSEVKIVVTFSFVALAFILLGALFLRLS